MPDPKQQASDYEPLLAEAARKAGWRVRRLRQSANDVPDLLVQAKSRSYLVEIKAGAEGRRDRLIPLLSQAILQARTAARRSPNRVVPVAIVAAARVPSVVA